MAQQDWIHNLLMPGAFPHETGDLQLLQTHISWIVLTGRYAYKIKKPVRFVFLDFSTRELRRQACIDEVRLNLRWDNDIYIEVCPVTGSHKQPCIAGHGAVIDFAVKMRQFDQDMLLSHCINVDKLQAHHFEEFALDLARFHQRANGSPGPDFGTPADIQRHVMGNLDILFQDDLPEPDMLLANWLREFSTRWFIDHHDLLVRRRAEGFVRECHGDLHLNNMLLRNGRIGLFDCLEFNASLRWCDVMSEIAFLAMDLENHKRSDLARRFVNAYIEHSGDHAGLSLLPFYIAYRAVVRAKVDQLQRLQSGHQLRRRLGLLRELESYLEEAAAYTREKQPRLAVMSGLSASGKTRHSRQLVDHGFIRIRSDFERKRLAGSTLDVPVQGSVNPGMLPPAEVLYSPRFTRRTYDELGRRAELCLAAGFSVVIDATCLKTTQRHQFIALAQRMGVPVRLFLLEWPTPVLEERIHKRRKRKNDLSDADIHVLHRQLEAREPLTAQETLHSTVIDCRKARAADVIGDWLALVSGPMDI